ncbi:hypothetical protein ABW21_db0202242 [Orbilia brochopaga]|nr:hypothetical protein ABW21_db0202242 [Drechslerella brochopaga]
MNSAIHTTTPLTAGSNDLPSHRREIPTNDILTGGGGGNDAVEALDSVYCVVAASTVGFVPQRTSSSSTSRLVSLNTSQDSASTSPRSWGVSSSSACRRPSRRRCLSSASSFVDRPSNEKSPIPGAAATSFSDAVWCGASAIFRAADRAIAALMCWPPAKRAM